MAGFVALLLAAFPVHAANIFWTGNGGDNLWSNTNNWHGFVLPETNDIAYLAHPTYTANEAQTVVVDMAVDIDRIYFSGTEDRATFLVATNAGQIAFRDITALNMLVSATADFTVDLPVEASGSQFRILNSAPDAVVTFGPNSVLSGAYARIRTGRFRLEETTFTTNPTRIMMGATVIADLKGGSLSPGIVSIEGTNGDVSPLYLASDAVVPTSFTILGANLSGAGGTGIVAAVESEVDVRLTIGELRSPVTDVLQIIPNPDSSSGNLVVQVDGWFTTSASIDTIAGSTVQVRSILTEVDNPGVSGAGNLLVKADSAETEVSIRRHMTYTGRTMIERGEMSFTATNPGSLSPETILEIGQEGTLRFLDHQQTVAGLRDYEGTAGAVEFMNANANLTVDTVADSAFGGEIHGNGAVRGTFEKTGAGSFTLTAGGHLYDVAAVRVHEGTLGIAGGRIEAGSFSLTGAVFSVTLSLSDEDATLVNVSGAADLTAATLQLARAPGYTPSYGTEYTLLNAASIAGASTADMFGYAHGDEIDVGGMPFQIHYIDDNDSIRLTAIPEPGSLALLALAAVGCLIGRRRHAS